MNIKKISIVGLVLVVVVAAVLFVNLGQKSNSGISLKDWNKNTISKDVPKPNFGTVTNYEFTEDTCNVVVEDVTIDQAREYGEKLKKAEYTQASYEDDQADTYYYQADNEARKFVAATFNLGKLNIYIYQQ